MNPLENQSSPPQPQVTNELIGDKDNPLNNHYVVEVQFVSAGFGVGAVEIGQ
jgi:hypothetical protein